jgi:hypothetical protein
MLRIPGYQPGDTVVIVAGAPPNQTGSTNLIRVHRLSHDDQCGPPPPDRRDDQPVRLIGRTDGETPGPARRGRRPRDGEPVAVVVALSVA